MNFELKFSIKYDTVKKSLLPEEDDLVLNNNNKKTKLEKRITSIKYLMKWSLKQIL